MRAIGNFLWFILGGALLGLCWWFVGLLAYATIIGIPWGKACFVIGQFSFFPFGKEAISRKDYAIARKATRREYMAISLNTKCIV